MQVDEMCCSTFAIHPSKWARSFPKTGFRYVTDPRTTDSDASGDEHMRNKSATKRRPNNIGPWYEALTAEQRAAHQERATRAQWGPKKELPKKADDGPWIWPLDLDRYDRSASLT